MKEIEKKNIPKNIDTEIDEIVAVRSKGSFDRVIDLSRYGIGNGPIKLGEGKGLIHDFYVLLTK